MKVKDAIEKLADAVQKLNDAIDQTEADTHLPTILHDLEGAYEDVRTAVSDLL